MKYFMKLLALIFVCIAVTGCTTRIGRSSKLDGYDNKLRAITVVYNQPKFSDSLIIDKLKKHNFQNLEEYLAKTTPSTFSSFGINAIFGDAKKLEVEKLSANDAQVLFIAPTSATVNRPQNVMAVPSSNPIGVEVQVSLFDAVLKKTVWSGQFKIVAGGLFYDHFCEKTASSFLRDIIEKLQSDGLIDKIQS